MTVTMTVNKEAIDEDMIMIEGITEGAIEGIIVIVAEVIEETTTTNIIIKVEININKEEKSQVLHLLQINNNRYCIYFSF